LVRPDTSKHQPAVPRAGPRTPPAPRGSSRELVQA
jgi:hypothetical protein